jgi:hypothetical protein
MGTTKDLLTEIALQNKKSLLLATLLVSVFAFQSAQAHAAKDSSSPCASFINSDFPKAVLSNGSVQAVVYLPDTQKGYYRSTRFDWSGVVPCLTYKGHTYFGIWFKHYDPLINDAIAGPVEEFRSSDGFSSINYNEAKPGELFIKPGVGVLRKVDNSPYNFGFRYPIVDLGKWKVRVKKDQVTFSQTLQSPLGYAYIYEKTLKLDKHQPILTLEHHLKNTGTKAIDTQVYDHDFFMLDGVPTGPGMAVHFAFEPQTKEPWEPRAKIDGKDIVYLREPKYRGGRPANVRISHRAVQFLVNPYDYLPGSLYSRECPARSDGKLEYSLPFLR